MMSLFSLPRLMLALASWLALVASSSGAVVGGGLHGESPSSQTCVDQGGNPITTGFCNKPLMISLVVVLSSLIFVTLAILAFLKFRRKKTDTKMMEELGIDVKISPSREPRDTVKIVKVKLPGLSVSIPSGKVSGENPRSPDSIITPTPAHVGQ